MILIHFLKDPVNECLNLLDNVDFFFFFFFFGDNIDKRHRKWERRKWEDKTYNVYFLLKHIFGSHI